MDPNKQNEQVKSGENSLAADISDTNKSDPNMVDGLKTGDDKQKRYYDMPGDEQMYNSFDEIREQMDQGDNTSESEDSPKP
jgi:hypothetical protein